MDVSNVTRETLSSAYLDTDNEFLHILWIVIACMMFTFCICIVPIIYLIKRIYLEYHQRRIIQQQLVDFP